VRIALATAIALAIAIPVDLAVESLAREAFAVSPDFEPFQGTVAPYTAGGIVIAAVVFAAIRRFVRDADRVYVRLAAIALVLSWIPDVALLDIHDSGSDRSRSGVAHGDACPRGRHRGDVAPSDGCAG
jgi:hypothetical protein